jgi:UDP-N-acetyl-2-amino-2-deoxyglucuronate dehydrogenase
MAQHRKPRFAVVGLGHKATSDYLPASRHCIDAELAAVCDVDGELAADAGARYGVPGFASLDDVIASGTIDFALLCLPHHAYVAAIEKLARAGIAILKEKPFATSIAEAHTIADILAHDPVPFEVSLTRRYHPIYRSFQQLLPKIGTIYAVEARYTMNVPRLDLGWRASRATAGGGALLDMGYHLVDLFVWYFGMPVSVMGKVGAGARPDQAYDVEDTASLLMEYDSPRQGNFVATLFVSRAYPEKTEGMTVLGTRGALELTRGELRRMDCDGTEIEGLSRRGSWLAAAVDQIDEFARRLLVAAAEPLSQSEHFAHLAVIEAAYLSALQQINIDPHSLLGERAPAASLEMK